VRRILGRDGIFLFSSLNIDGRSYSESPLQICRPGQPWDRSPVAAALLLWRNGCDPLRLFRRYRNWRKLQPQTARFDGWGISSMAPSDFTLLNHFTSLSRLREEVSEANLDIIAIYGSDAECQPLPLGAITTTDDYFYVLARKSSIAGEGSSP
jgi:hypothetical protein